MTDDDLEERFARARGPRPPPEDIIDAEIERRKLNGNGHSMPQTLAEKPIPFLTLAELKDRARAVRWLVKGAVPSESIGVLFGASGTFKSFVALDLALHVAHGIPWLGRKTQQGPVIIIAAEGGAGIWWRIAAWHKLHGIRWDVANVRVIPAAVDLMHDAERICALASAADVVPALVVVDTMSQTFPGGEENSASEVSTYLRELGLWFREAWQCVVLVIHHTGHSQTERPRGSSALSSNVDFVFGVSRDEKEMLATIGHQKNKDGELMEDTVFSIDVHEVGTDDDGKAITSLSASALQSAQVVAAVQYEASRGRGGRNNLFIELAVNGIEEKKLRTVFMEAIDGDSNAKRQSYFKCKKWAVSNGLVEIAEGYVIKLGSR